MSDKFELPESLKTASIEQWRSIVEKSLNGKTINEALAFKTHDAIEIKPLYSKDDAIFEAGSAVLRSNITDQDVTGSETSLGQSSFKQPWKIIQLTDIPCLKAANKQIQTDLQGGASGLYLSISNDIPYASAELPVYSTSDYKKLFENIDLTGKTIYFSNGREGLVNAANFVSYIKDEKIDLGAIEGSFGFDPLSIFASLGSFPEPEDEALINWVDGTLALSDMGCQMSAFMACGRTWQQAGSSEAMELGFTLAAALSYVRTLEDAGLTIDEALQQVDISLTTNSDIFLSTAKLRAMRLLWSKITAACGAKTAPTKFIAQMSFLGLTKADPEVNMLRATVSTVAAGLGNVDALVLLPFSAAHGVANQAARRLAINTQIIAQEESYIGQVEDPAAGSWYVESLTNELAAKAWAIFQKTEQAGGMAKMLKSGAVKVMIDEVREVQINDISTGVKEITGVTTFPNLNEKVPDLFEDETEEWVGAPEGTDTTVPQLKAPELRGANKGARFKDIILHLAKGAPTYILDEALEGPATLKTMLGDLDNRIVEDVEFLRNLSDEVLALNGSRPGFFLANIGSPAEYTARATWAKSYFETGGIEALGNEGYLSTEDIITGFQTSGATIACLCSSDKLYEAQATAAARALLQAGAEAIYIVARPKFLKKIAFEDRSLFQSLLYQGTDVVSTLVEAHQIIGFADETIAV